MTHEQDAACWRMWIAGRAQSLRARGLDPVKASMRATHETQQIRAGKCPNCKAPTEDSWLIEGERWRCPECNTPPTMMEMTR